MYKTESKSISYKCSDNNIFLTTAMGFNNNNKRVNKQKLANEKVSNHVDSNELQNLQKSIISIVLEFKSLPDSIQLTHQFNEILYCLDTQIMNKKNIHNVISALKTQTNLIKLTRIYQRLKMLKKSFSKLNLSKSPQKTLKKTHSSQCFRTHLLQLHPHPVSNICQTLPNQNKQNHQWKQKIINEISYRQRLSKIQSQTQKHSLNKQQFIKKKQQKVKEMNKKASQIFQKNKKLHKQRINKYKYQQLFDPNQISSIIRKRAEMMNPHSKPQSCSQASQIDNVSDQFLTQPTTFNPKDGLQKDQFKNQDIKTFKTLNDLINSNIKKTKSFKNLQKQKTIETNKNIKKSNSYYCTPVTKNNQFDKTFNHTFQSNVLSFQDIYNKKRQLVKQRKTKLEKQRFNKMITQAVQKQKKILHIYQHRNCSPKTKKNSPKKTHSKDDLSKSFETLPQKRPFKKVIITKKELMDKQRQILMNIESKIDRKNQFLQQRVNSIKQKLKEQQQTKLNYKKYWEQYVHLTQCVSALQSIQLSPSKKHLRSHQLSADKQRQKVIKKSFFNKVKQTQQKLQQMKLNNIPLQQLKKKLIQIENQQKASQSKSIF